MSMDDEANDHAPASAEVFITSLFAKAGWETPGRLDAAGVLAFRHPKFKITALVRHLLQNDGSTNMVTVTFDDTAFVASFAEHGGWSDYGEHIGGGLFMLRDVRLGHFLLQSFEHEYARVQRSTPVTIPFVFRHRYQS